MPTHSKYRCPLCNSPLTREAYSRVVRHNAHSSARIEKEARKAAAHERQQRLKFEVLMERRLREAKETAERNEARHRRETEQYLRQLALLQRKADAKNVIHFGPEGEEELLKDLRRQFEADGIVRKGRGGDIIHTVVSRGRNVGKIIYECKRTSTWNSSFVRQLKQDMEAHGTRWGILVTLTMPPKQNTFCVIDGVACCVPTVARHVARIFRDAVIAMSASAREGNMEAKAAAIIDYLQGEEFRSAIHAVNHRTEALRTQLAKEKASHTRWWNQREASYSAIARQSSGVDDRIQEILSSSSRSRPRLRVVQGRG